MRRVIQFSTGNVGRHSLVGIDARPDLELVGVWVSSDAKAGAVASVSFLAVCAPVWAAAVAARSNPINILRIPDSFSRRTPPPFFVDMCQLWAEPTLNPCDSRLKGFANLFGLARIASHLP